MPEAIIGGTGSYFAGEAQKEAIQRASDLQLKYGRQAIKAQRAGADKAFDIFQRETERSRDFLRQYNTQAQKQLAPFQKIGLENLQRANELTDPNSAQSEAERQAFQRVLTQNLAARGLTGSGTEIAGLTDFEVGLGQQRRQLAFGLANLGGGIASQSAGMFSNLGGGLAQLTSGFGSGAANIFAQRGANTASILSGMGSNLSNLQIAQGQAQAQQIAGITNAVSAQMQNDREMGAAALPFFLSDQRMKSDLYPIREELDELMASMNPKSFSYVGRKDTQYGVLAQDVEKSTIGKSLVHEDKNGIKYINSTKALAVILASLSRIDERLRKAGV